MENVQTYQRKNYTSLDVVKFCCALIILLYHWASEWGCVPSLFQELFSLYAIVLPIFLTISGFLFFDKVLSVEKKEQRSVLIHQIKRIFSVYFFWSIGYVVFQIYRWFTVQSTITTVLADIWGWLTYSTFYTIWFMPALAIGLVVAYLIYRKWGLKRAFIIALLLYFIGTLGLTYSFLGEKIKVVKVFYDWFRSWFTSTRNGIFYTPVFITIGGLVALQRDRLKMWQSFLGTFFAGICLVAEALVLKLSIGGTGIDMALCQVVFAWFAMEFILNLKFDFIDSNISIWMRKVSVVVFVSQRYFLSVIPFFFSEEMRLQVKSNNNLSFCIMVGGTLVFSMLIIRMSKKKSKFSRLLY